MNKNIIIPTNWKWVTLDDISKKITDGSHNPPKGVDSGFPMLSAKNIQNNFIDFSNVRYLTGEDFKIENQRTSLEPMDILLTTVGTIGRVALVPQDNSKFVLQRSVTVIKPLVNPKYLLYYILSSDFQKMLIKNSSGTAQKGIYLNVLKTLKVPLAPIEEQNRIVDKIEELFSELDKSNEELIKSKELAKVLVNKTIYNLFKNLNNHKPLSEVSEIIMGQSPSSNSYNVSGLGIALFQGKKEFTELYPIAEKWTTSPIRTAKENDILMSVRAPVGDVNISNIACCIGRGLSAIRFRGYHKFLFYYLNSIKEEIRDLGTGTTFSSISRYIISNISVPFPSYDKQFVLINDLETKLSNYNKLFNEIEAQVRKINNLKSKVLQDIFQGKLTPQYISDSSTELLLIEISKLKKEYIENQIEIKKNKPKYIKMEKEKLSIIEVLEKHNQPINAEKLWQESKHEKIDDFYENLKKVEHLVIQDISKRPAKISLK